MDRCENCSSEILEKIGSGRFCTIKCSRSFSTKSNRELISKKASEKLKGRRVGYANLSATNQKMIKINCQNCNKEFEVPYKLRNRKNCSRSCSSTKKGRGFFKVDWGSINRGSYKNKSRKIAGGSTKWIQYKGIKVQGSYEYKACEILDDLTENKKILSWDYSNIRIPYIDADGISRIYIVDFSYKDLSGMVNLLEVKGRKIDNDDIKWKSARDAGYNLTIWGKKEIFSERTPYLINVL